MTLEPITCNNCGAALDVPPEANFVTCAFCGSRLAVKRTPSVVYTEVLQQLDERTQRISGDVRQLQIANELERIDREWEEERQQYLIRSRAGSTSEPTEGAVALRIGLAVVTGLVAAVVLFGWAGSGVGDNSGCFILAGLFFIGVVVLSIIDTFSKGQNYRKAQDAYQTRRADVYDQFKRE